MRQPLHLMPSNATCVSLGKASLRGHGLPSLPIHASIPPLTLKDHAMSGNVWHFTNHLRSSLIHIPCITIRIWLIGAFSIIMLDFPTLIIENSAVFHIRIPPMSLDPPS